mmetsp:Transcript_73660/g.227483  ORF Transcript_73660/g.227483 Transcript_73660/m.227483 type:complete len:208 (-) Transcript_73660:637-1260(-)
MPSVRSRGSAPGCRCRAGSTRRGWRRRSASRDAGRPPCSRSSRAPPPRRRRVHQWRGRSRSPGLGWRSCRQPWAPGCTRSTWRTLPCSSCRPTSRSTPRSSSPTSCCRSGPASSWSWSAQWTRRRRPPATRLAAWTAGSCAGLRTCSATWSSRMARAVILQRPQSAEDLERPQTLQVARPAVPMAPQAPPRSGSWGSACTACGRGCC